MFKHNLLLCDLFSLSFQQSFDTFISGDHNMRVLSRAKAKLVIVCNEEYVLRFIPEDEHSNNHATIVKVLGKTYLGRYLLYPAEKQHEIITDQLF